MRAKDLSNYEKFKYLLESNSSSRNEDWNESDESDDGSDDDSDYAKSRKKAKVDKNLQLIDAIRLEKLSLARQLLAEGADPNSRAEVS